MTDSTGYFCVTTYTVASPEGGEYKYTVATCPDFGGGCEKHDNYGVDEVVPLQIEGDEIACIPVRDLLPKPASRTNSS